MQSQIPNNIVVQLNEIAERLWSGHASIMVGAGFSKNAVRNSSNSKSFLSWNELADEFHKKIYDQKPSNGQNYLNPMKLAEEVCAAFGRPALEKLMQSVLPDLDYSPSDIHRSLLDLPWNDVFTTNYDTLLERTKVSQRYDVVLSKGDLVFSQRPRIIKLHGSFPSNRPFIITEEDYRRYPNENAAFVNTVQQSLIENTLCLIGFSGDDPNFLSWIGWIRDNLGNSNSPRIYLIGVLNLSPSQLKVLEQRNIAIIDLSTCVQGETNTHGSALQTFISFLKSKKSEENRLDWPQNDVSLSPLNTSSQEDYLRQLNLISLEWKRVRNEYPGWVVCPSDARSTIWHNTSRWLHGMHLKITTTACIDLAFWHELAWRLEKVLCPLFDNIADAIERSIARYNPFPDVFVSNSEFSRHLNSEIKNWNEISDSWIYLNFSLLRYYREEGLAEKWETLNSKFKLIQSKLAAHQRDKLNYEQCLFYLSRQEIQNFRIALQNWKPADAAPYSQAKKAGLLAENGDINEAKSLLENALQIVRSQLNLVPITTDYSHLSQEAYILQLLNFINNSSWEKNESQGLVENVGSRLTKLKQYKCDPWGELQLFNAKLTGVGKGKKDIELVHGFDIGHTSKTHRFGSDRDALEAFAFLRYIDDIGFPYRIQNMSFGTESARGAIARISKISLNWAISTLLRSGDSKSVESLFDRSFLFDGAESSIESLVVNLLKLMMDVDEDIARDDSFRNQSLGIHYAKIVPEILSRLCTRCSLESLKKILSFLQKVYSSPHKENYSNIDHLAQRLVSSWPPEQMGYLILKCLSEFPIIGDPSEFVRREFPEILGYFEPVDSETKSIQIVLSESVTENFLSQFENSNNNGRQPFFDRLHSIYKFNLMNEEQKIRFGSAIWKIKDATGFPAGLDSVYRWYFFKLPHVENIDIASRIHNFFSEMNFSTMNGNKKISAGLAQNRSFYEIINGSHILEEINWTSQNAVSLFQKIIQLWDSDKHTVAKAKGSSSDLRFEENTKYFHAMARVVELAVVPFLTDEEFSEIKADLCRLIAEMNLDEVPTSELEAALFERNPFDLRSILLTIERDVLSDIRLKATRGVIAATKILKSEKCATIEFADYDKLVTLLVEAIKWRKPNSLIPALANFQLIVIDSDQRWRMHLPQLLLGLQMILDETKLNYEGGPIPLADRLFARKEAARLSFELNRIFTEEGISIPHVVASWHTVCLSSNEFAEIRNEWPN